MFFNHVSPPVTKNRNSNHSFYFFYVLVHSVVADTWKQALGKRGRRKLNIGSFCDRIFDMKLRSKQVEFYLTKHVSFRRLFCPIGGLRNPAGTILQVPPRVEMEKFTNMTVSWRYSCNNIVVIDKPVKFAVIVLIYKLWKLAFSNSRLAKCVDA